jgi:hypothetical protein
MEEYLERHESEVGGGEERRMRSFLVDTGGRGGHTDPQLTHGDPP